MPIAIQIQDFSFRFADSPKGIENVCLSVESKEAIAIMGPSGSGKTTLALSILGLQPKKVEVEGKIFFFNRDLSQMKWSEKRKILGSEVSILMQDPSCALNPFFTLGFHFRELLKKHFRGWSKRQRDEKICNALSEVGLKEAPSILKAYPHQLSGGEKQRALIAMAVLNAPKILIADELAASLDLVIKVEIIKLIQFLQREKGFALILITHDPLVAKKVCSKVYEIKDSKLTLKKEVIN